MTSTTGRGGPGQTPVPGGGKASVHVSAGPPKKQRTDWDLLRYLAQEIAPQRAVFFLAVGLYLPLTAVSVLQPVVLRAAIDDGVARHDLSAVTAWAVVFLLLVCLRAVIEAWQGWVMQGLGQRAVRELRMRLFRKLQRLPMAVFDRVPLGKLMTRVSNDTESLAELFSSGAVSVIGDLFFLVGTLVMLLLVNVELSLSTMATLPFLVVGVQFFRRRARGAFARVRAAVSQMNATLQELLSGMTVVQLFDQVPRAQQRFEADNADYLKANREAIALDAGVYAFVDAVSYVAVALALFAAERIGIVGVQPGGALSLGVLVAFVDALGRFYAPIRELSNKATIFQSALVAADRIIELDEEQETIVAPAAPSPARLSGSCPLTMFASATAPGRRCCVACRFR